MLSLLYLGIKAQQYFVSSSCMFLEKKIKINHLLRNRALINTAHEQRTYASFSLDVSKYRSTLSRLDFFQGKAAKFEQLLACSRLRDSRAL